MDSLCYKYLNIQGRKIGWYQSITINPNRKSLLFVHGIASQSNHWMQLIKKFENSYNIYLLDRPGYGKSDIVKVESIEEYVILCEAVITRMNIKSSLTYIGHSMGAYLGLKLSLRENPFEKMILLAPFTSYTVDKNLIDYKEKCKKRVIELLRNSFSKYTDYSVIEQYLKDVNTMHNEAIWNDFYMISSDKIQTELLSKIKTNVFIIHAFDDRVVSYRKSLVISRMIKSSRIFLMNEGGHNCFISNARTMSKIVERYIME